MNRAEPPYVRIVNELRRRIEHGELRAGDRVPSTRQLTQDWGVAMATATKALAALRQQGLVHALPGVGTVVTDRPSGRTSAVRERGAPGVDRERIVRTAVDLADADGLAAVSMRRIATELGAATMSLYRHVGGKDELVQLMIETVAGDDPLPEQAPAGWRPQLELLARAQWALFRRHPWLASAISLTRPTATPNLAAHAEWALRAVDGLGLSLSDMLYLHITLFNYVRGTAVNLEPEAQAVRDTGLTADEWVETQDTDFHELIASGRLPTLARVATQQNFDFDLDVVFEFGLRQMLDGIGVFIETHRTNSRR